MSWSCDDNIPWSIISRRATSLFRESCYYELVYLTDKHSSERISFYIGLDKTESLFDIGNLLYILGWTFRRSNLWFDIGCAIVVRFPSIRADPILSMVWNIFLSWKKIFGWLLPNICLLRSFSRWIICSISGESKSGFTSLSESYMICEDIISIISS
jgi:hypothetical protein